MKCAVLIGSVWRRRDPSGEWQTFEVRTFSTNPHGQRVVKGRAGSKTITCSLVAMENGDPRFEHVHDDYVEQRAVTDTITGRRTA